MLKLMFAAAILIVSNASAGEIVWRSATSGTLTAVSDPVPPLEPEQPAFGVRYEPIHVAAGTTISVTPIGDTSGYVFSAQSQLPPGLTLDPATGRIVGFAAVGGKYNVTIRVEKDGSYSDLVTSINVS